MPNYSGVWTLSQQFQAVGQGLWPFDDGTVGIFALGSSSTTRNKYTYSGCVVSAGGASTAVSTCGSAAGNSTVGIFALGLSTCSVRSVTRKNTYGTVTRSGLAR